MSRSIEVFPRPLILHRDMSLTETGTDCECVIYRGRCTCVGGNLLLKESNEEMSLY